MYTRYHVENENITSKTSVVNQNMQWTEMEWELSSSAVDIQVSK